MGPESSPSLKPTATPEVAESSRIAAPEADEFWLKVWRLHPQGVRIVPAERTLRGTAPEGAARFCGPFTHANRAGWWVFPPVDLDITWRGGLEFDHTALTEYSDIDSCLIQFLMDADERAAARNWLPAGRTKFTWGLVEPGVAQIWTGCIFQTPPGWGLHIRSPINCGTPGFHVMEAILETDWLHTDIWLNVAFHDEGRCVSLRRDQWPPIAQIVPVRRESYDVTWRCEEATLDRSTPEANRVFEDFIDYQNRKFSHGGRQRWSKEDPKLTKDSTAYYRARRRARHEGDPAEGDPAGGTEMAPAVVPASAPSARTSARPQARTREIRLAYQRYVTSVTSSAHAISLQLALYLEDLVATRSPARVADLGSGFSSYVLRLLAGDREPAIEVWSVDDDPAWLAKTRAFLTAEGLSTDRTVLWPELAQDSFDLVLHDLGSMSTREATLTEALSLVKAGGALVLDDLQFPDYRRHVEETLRARGVDFASAEEQTLDMLGRYSWVAFPQAGPRGHDERS